MGSDSIDFMSSLECTRFPAFLFESITLTVLNQSSLTPLIFTIDFHRSTKSIESDPIDSSSGRVRGQNVYDSATLRIGKEV